MDAQAAKQQIEHRIAELNKLISNSVDPDVTLLSQWCMELDQLEEMLQPTNRGFGS